jgi:hypothetical protein
MVKLEVGGAWAVMDLANPKSMSFAPALVSMMFQVAMDDAGLVGFLQTLADFNSILQQLFGS